MLKRVILCILLVFFLFACEEESNNNSTVSNSGSNEQTLEENQLNNKFVESHEDTEEGTQMVEEVKLRIKIDVDILNFRADSGTDSEILGKLYKDCVYEVIDSKEINGNNESELWYKVSVGNQVGWIAGWFCSETESDLMDINIPMNALEISLNRIYLKGTSVNFNDFIDWDDYELVYETESLNIHDLNEAYQIRENGTLRVLLKDSLGRSKEHNMYIEAYRNDDVNKVLYKTMDFSSEIIGQEDVREIDYSKNSEGHISIVDGHVQAWYQVEYNGQTCYMFEEDSAITFGPANFNRYNVYLTSGEKVVVEGDGTAYTRFEKNDLVWISHSAHRNTLVDVNTGQVYYFNFLEFNEDRSRFMTFNCFSDGRFREKDILKTYALYEVKDKGIELLFEKNISHIGVENVTFLDENTIGYKVFYDNQNPWTSTNPLALSETYSLSLVDDQPEERLIVGNVKEINTIDYNEVITVYENMKEDSSILSEVKRRDISQLVYTRTFDVINSELCDWFKVLLEDGREGFAYRPRTEKDGMDLFLNEPMYFILENGDLHTIETDGFGAFIYSLDDSLIFNDVVIYYYNFEGSGAWFESAIDASYLDLPLRGFIYVNPDKTYLADATYAYIEGDSDLTIYKIDDKDYLEEVRIVTNQGSFNDIKWFSGTECTFNLSVYEDESFNRFPGSLYLEDDQWILSKLPEHVRIEYPEE